VRGWSGRWGRGGSLWRWGRNGRRRRGSGCSGSGCLLGHAALFLDANGVGGAFLLGGSSLGGLLDFTAGLCFLGGLDFGLLAREFGLGALACFLFACFAFGFQLLALKFLGGAAALVFLAPAPFLGFLLRNDRLLALHVQTGEEVANQVLFEAAGGAQLLGELVSLGREFVAKAFNFLRYFLVIDPEKLCYLL
jgi:hypothetical protein